MNYFEEKDKTLGEDEDPAIVGLFIITDEEINNIVEQITSRYPLAFDKTQLAGFKKNSKEISVKKNGDEYSISGDFYEGILSTRVKLLEDVASVIKYLNDVFIEKGKDIQDELKISIEDATPPKTVIGTI